MNLYKKELHFDADGTYAIDFTVVEKPRGATKKTTYTVHSTVEIAGGKNYTLSFMPSTKTVTISADDVGFCQIVKQKIDESVEHINPNSKRRSRK